MNCRDAQKLLHDYLDSELAPDVAADVDRHLGGCEICEERERKLRELVENASSLPKSIDPPRDLWPGIAERLETVDRDAPVPFARRTTAVPKWGYGLLAASIMIAVVAGVYLGRDGTGSDLAGGSESLPGVVVENASLGTPTETEELFEAEESIVDAKQGLRVAFDARRDSLDPETVETVDRNLELIDDAIAEIHVALENAPESPELNRLLMAAHRRELYLLQRAMQLAARL